MPATAAIAPATIEMTSPKHRPFSERFRGFPEEHAGCHGRKWIGCACAYDFYDESHTTGIHSLISGFHGFLQNLMARKIGIAAAAARPIHRRDGARLRRNRTFARIEKRALIAKFCPISVSIDEPTLDEPAIPPDDPYVANTRAIPVDLEVSRLSLIPHNVPVVAVVT